MTLPVSGPISFSDLQTEYGDTGSLSASELYRGGGIVPETVLDVGAFTGYLYSTGATAYYMATDNTNNSGFRWYWGDFITIGPYLENNHIYNGYQYNYGNYQESSNGFDLYEVRRRTYVNSTANTSVPASGELDLSNFYGGRG